MAPVSFVQCNVIDSFAEEAQELFEQSPIVKTVSYGFIIVVNCLALCAIIMCC